MPDIAQRASTATTKPSTAAESAEIVGRPSPPRARAAAAEPEPALVRAGSAVRPSGSTATASGMPMLDAPGAPPGWSFRGGFGRPDTTAVPPPSLDQAELPLDTVPTARVAPLPPQPHFGPIGRSRSPLLVPLLAAVTLGIYALVWHQRMNRELEEFDPKLHSRPLRSALALAVPWLVGLVVTLAGAAIIVGGRLSVHLPLASHVSPVQSYLMLGGLAAVPYLTLLLPISLVAVVMTLERLRCVEEHVGTTTDRQVRPVGATLLLAVPVAGGLVLLAAEQRRLNAIWNAVATSGRSSR